MGNRLSRRGFLAGSAAAATLAGACLPGVDADWADPNEAQCSWTDPTVTAGDPTYAGRVVEVFDQGLTSGKNLVESAVTAALKKTLLTLTKQSELDRAWQALIPDLAQKPASAIGTVGIKVNVLNQGVPTHPTLVKALVDLLKTGAGLSAGQLLVWDRRLDELTKSGFTAASIGAKVEGTWDDARLQGNGQGYEQGTVCIVGRNAHLTNILTRRIDHLINVAVMKRHTLSGVTGVMKNHYGSIDNPGEFHNKYEGGVLVSRRLEKAIPALNALDEVQRKTRLLLVDATIGVCKGDTDSSADCAPNRILASLDPVAMDARTREIRDLARGSAGKDPETISDSWLTGAEKAGLGQVKPVLETVS